MIRLWMRSACRDARARMIEGVEGKLSQRERLTIGDHLARCGSCADELVEIAAAHHAARRALEPYRRARARVAPGRARLRAYGAVHSEPRALVLLRRLGRPAEQSLVFAVLALAFVGSLPSSGAPERSAPRGAATTSGYVRVADDPGGLVRLRLLQSERIPVGDGLLIDVFVDGEVRASPERPRQGLQTSTPY